MTALIETWTNFGDLATLLPLALVVALWLLAIRRSEALLWWLGALALCGGGTAVMKVYFFVCPPLIDLHSPSGHTSLSTLVYGAITLIVAAGLSGWRRIIVLAAGAAFIAGIGVSRVVIHAHSIPEVLVGSFLGVAALALFARQFKRLPPPQSRFKPLIAVCALLMVLLHGQDLRAEDMLHAVGLYLDHAGMACF